MGMITSDFYNKFGNIDIVEAPFTAGELIRMASVDVQEQFADWTEENDDAGYIPAHIMLTLLEDRAFFEQLSEWVDSGEFVVLSGAALACTSAHIGKMGLTKDDVRQNIIHFFEKSEEMTYSIEAILSGTNEWVSSLYVFANGWVGIETERLSESWEDPDDTDHSTLDGTPEPAASYLIDSEGELVASPDIRYDIEAWMDFVDMFSAVHEEASAADAAAGAPDSEVVLRHPKDGYIVFSE